MHGHNEHIAAGKATISPEITRHLAAAHGLLLATGKAEDSSFHTAASADEHRLLVLLATKDFRVVDPLLISDLCILYNHST